jgi:hypothetical protein
MSQPEQEQTRRRGLIGRLVFGGGKWYWMLLRLAVIVGLIVVFRCQVLTWAALGHNAAWKAATGAEENHTADLALLKRLRRPGAQALARLGEAEALASIHDPAMAPALRELVGTHEDPAIRRGALEGLARSAPTPSAGAACAALEDPDAGVRTLAAHVLGDLGEAACLPALRAAAEREADPDALGAMRRATEALGTPRPAPDAPPAPEHIHKH